MVNIYQSFSHLRLMLLKAAKSWLVLESHAVKTDLANTLVIITLPHFPIWI